MGVYTRGGVVLCLGKLNTPVDCTLLVSQKPFILAKPKIDFVEGGGS